MDFILPGVPRLFSLQHATAVGYFLVLEYFQSRLCRRSSGQWYPEEIYHQESCRLGHFPQNGD